MDLFSDQNSPLDAFMIANLLANFVRSEPDSHPMSLPSFRLKQLRERAATTFSGQANLLEAVGSLYCICMYHSMTPQFDDEMMLSCSLLMQTVVSECLEIIQSGVSFRAKPNILQLSHPVDSLFRKQTQARLNPRVFDTFSESFELSKEILRDITRQVRNAQDRMMNKSSSKEKYPKDCLMAHSIYFMCVFGLTHTSCVLKSTNNLNAIPGLSELLVLVSICELRDKMPNEEALYVLPQTKALPTASAVEVSSGNTGNEAAAAATAAYKAWEDLYSRFERCIMQSNKLASAAVLQSLDERTLQEVRMVRTRMEKNISHPSVAFASLSSSAFKKFLLDRRPAAAVGSSGGSTKKSTSATHSTAGSAAISAGNFFQIGFEHPNGLFIEPEEEAADTATDSFIVPTSPGDDSSVPSIRSAKAAAGGGGGGSVASGSDSMTVTTKNRGEGAARGKKSARSTKNDSNNDNNNDNNDNTALVSTFWSLKHQYRPAFLALQPLHRRRPSRVYFSAGYHPEGKIIRVSSTTAKSGLSKRDLLKCVDELEGVYYIVDDYFCPRHLNPSFAFYWLATFLVEYMYQKTAQGEGFSKSLKSVTGNLRAEVSAMRTNRMGIASNHDDNDNDDDADDDQAHSYSGGPVQLVLGTTADRRTMLTPKRASSSLSSLPQVMSPLGRSSARKQKKDPHTTTMSLIDRLQLASLEAKTESKLIAIESQLKTEAKDKVHEELLVSADATLRTGISTIKKVKQEIAKMKVDQFVAEKSSRHLLTTGSFLSGAAAADAGPRRRVVVMEKHQVDKMVEARRNHVDPVAAFTDDPTVRDIRNFRQKIRRAGLIEAADDVLAAGGGSGGAANMTMNAAATNKNVSVVWSSRDGGGGEGYSDSGDPSFVGGSRGGGKRGGGGGGTDQAAKAYAKLIIDYQKEQKELEEEHKRMLMDQQELEVSTAKARILNAQREAKETKKMDQRASHTLRIKYLEERKVKLLEERAQAKETKRRIQEENELEKGHVQALKDWKRFEEEKARKAYEASIEYQQVRIKLLGDSAEMEENIRRAVEEARMKYLEERVRAYEEREERVRAKKEKELQDRRDVVREIADRMTAKVRAGNFIWHNGKFSFYPDVRPEPVPWVEFEDQQGGTFYFDPLTNKKQYRMPVDAPVVRANDGDRSAYDSIYGAGAYDQFLRDQSFMDAYNRDGGYYDADDTWVPATGYYDVENGYQFVQYNGYYREDGKYILYPKPEGDLGFMV